MRRDEAYVLDILIAARKARGFTAHTSAVEFENNELLHNATARMLEVIDEAAGKIGTN